MTQTSKIKPRPSRATTLSLFVSMADTTVRMSVPSLIFVACGLYSDIRFDTAPLYTLIGLIVGLGISVMLVRAQLRTTK